MKKTFVKYSIIVAVILLLAGMIYLSVSHSIEMNRPDNVQPIYYSLKYGVEGEGRIEGETQQTVEALRDGQPIEAIAAEGWYFKGWSDVANQLSFRQDCRVTHSVDAKAIFEKVKPKYFSINFRAMQGGRVEGELYQLIDYGKNGSTVIAIPDEGYRFVKWSDGETEAIRENLHVTDQASDVIYAEFERYSRLFTYHYNKGTSISSESNILITLDNLNSISFPVPQREGYRFEGWYSDWHHTLQVSDEFGNLIVGKDWFQGTWWYDTQINPENHLYAKWKALKTVPTYKILLIFVTEVHGDFEGTNGNMIRVDTVMSDLQKKLCLKIARRMETYLEALLYATIDFEIDTYFTQKPLTQENFYQGTTGLPDSSGTIKLFYDYGIDVKHNGIPEVNAIIGNYRSVLTTFNLNDLEGQLHATAGNAEAKFGEIHYEAIDRGYVPPDMTQEDMYFDETYPGVFLSWSWHMELYIHEFTHTVELQPEIIGKYGIHEAESDYSQIYGAVDSPFRILGPYLRGEYQIKGENVGIPYSFWDGTDQGENIFVIPSIVSELKADYYSEEKKYFL